MIKTHIIVFGFIEFAFILGFLGLRSTRKMRKKRCTVPTIGKVVDNVWYAPTYDSYLALFPIIEYSVGNEVVRNRYRFGKSPKPQYNIGQELQIYYNKDNPNDFYIADDGTPQLIENIFKYITIAIPIIAIIIITVIIASGAKL
jgi:hypothetical protein